MRNRAAAAEHLAALFSGVDASYPRGSESGGSLGDDVAGTPGSTWGSTFLLFTPCHLSLSHRYIVSESVSLALSRAVSSVTHYPFLRPLSPSHGVYIIATPGQMRDGTARVYVCVHVFCVYYAGGYRRRVRGCLLL